MRRAVAALGSLVFCVGCSHSDLFDSPLDNLPINANRDPALTSYLAYGDSVTFGVGVGDPATQGYVAFVAHSNVLPYAIRARSGDQGCDVPTNQIFPKGDSPSTADKKLYTILIGGNDANDRGPGPYEAVFNLCHQATIAWLALPLQYKLFGSSAGVATFGATHVETANNWNAVTTDAQGAGLSFPLQLAARGVIYIWYRVHDGSTGTFTCSLDGQIVASAASAASEPMATQNGTTDSLGLLRLPAIAAGAHTLILSQTSSGASGMGIVAVGVPPVGSISVLPPVLVGTVGRELIGGTGPCSNNDTSCLAYIADITANVALIQGDGLNVTLFNTRKYMTGTSADMFDSLHPNVFGNEEIYEAIQDIFN